MLYAAKTAQSFLISPHVEESDILVAVGSVFGQENGIGVRLCIIVILTITSKPTKVNPFIFLIPVVDCQKGKRWSMAQVSGKVVMNELSIIFQSSLSFCFFWLTIE